jgi:hypothetical protein
MITASTITNSSLTGVVNTLDPTMASPVPEGGATRPNLLPNMSGTPGRQISGSQAMISRDTVRRAQEAVDAIDTMNTWKNAVNAIKWVMETVSPIAAVCPVSFLLIRPELTSTVQLNPCANLAWTMLSKIPEVRFRVFSQVMGHCSPCC